MRIARGFVAGCLWLLVGLGTYGCGNGGGNGTVTGETETFPRYAYSVSRDDPYVLMFRVDASTGQWHARGAMPRLGAEDLAVDPSGRFAYVAGGEVSMLRIDPSTGDLSEFASTSGLPEMAHSSALVVEPMGRSVYVAWQRQGEPDFVAAYAIDATSGLLTRIGDKFLAGAQPCCLSADPSGRFLYVANHSSDNVSTFRIDQVTGSLSKVGLEFYTGDGPRAVCVNASGEFVYVANAFSDDVTTFAIDQGTGQLSRVDTPLSLGLNASGSTLDSFTLDPQGRFAYAGGFDDVVVLTLDPVTGLPSVVGTGDVRTLTGTMLVDPSGRFLYAGGREQGNRVSLPGFSLTDENGHVGLYRIDPASGALAWASEARVQRSFHGRVTMTTGPAPATVSPRWVFVANELAGAVQVFAVEASTGELRAVGAEVAAGDGPCALVASRAGRFVYAANRVSGDVTTFAVNPATGALTRQGVAIATGDGAASLAIEPSGRFLYVANELAATLTILAIDPTSGALSPSSVETPIIPPSAVAVEPTGQNLYQLGINGFVKTSTIDPDTGASTGVSTNWESGNGTRALLADPTGRFLYAVNEIFGDVTTYRIHTTTLSAFPIPATGWLVKVGGFVRARIGANAMAVHPTGRFAYVTNAPSDDVTTFTIDAATGTLTEVGTEVAVGDGPSAVAVDPSGAFVYVTNRLSGDVTTFTVDQDTGRLTEVGSEVATGAGPAAIVIVGEYR